MKDIKSQTEAFVQPFCKGDFSGHDWWHVHRVRNLALKFAKEEGGADLQIVEAAALLHDIDDWKLRSPGDPYVEPFLKSVLGDNAPEIELICGIIYDISFKGANVQTPQKTIEGKCVQDADRLDAIGAIGIARVFAFGGRHNRPIHDPEYVPSLHTDFESYKRSDSTSIGHFYEKLLHIQGKMQTNAGRRIAEERSKYTKDFLARFLDEWASKA
jgi:uncharacterized protein